MRGSPLGKALETGNFTKQDEKQALRCSTDETSEVEWSIPQCCPQVSYIAYTLRHRKWVKSSGLAPSSSSFHVTGADTPANTL